MANNEGVLDPERIIYNLQDLKALKKQLFFVRTQYVSEGYRACPCMTVKKASSTLFMIHNETLNVWTHLVPVFYYSSQLLMVITNTGAFE